MMPLIDDDTIQRAARIVGRSQIAAVADRLIRGSVAGISSSSTSRVVRRWRRGFHSLPPAVRMRCLSIAFAAAVAGHVLLAAMLPAAAKPTTPLTVVALLGACVATAAIARAR